MQDLVNWLIDIEYSASEVYAKAAELFSEDAEFSSFLKQLSREEKGHCDAMHMARVYLQDTGDVPAVVSMDEETRWDIEAPFIECRTRIEDGKITRKELMNYIVIIEYSELNQLFTYAINTVRERSGGIVNIAYDIDNHKKHIEDFAISDPDLHEFLERIKGLPKTSDEKKRILIVDDTRNNVELLKAIFAGKFAVDTASDGEEAFRKVSGNHYSAIITDVDMPVMDGFAFYARALEILPGIGERIIFYTAGLDRERMSFMHANRLKYLTKPAPIKKLRALVSEITC